MQHVSEILQHSRPPAAEDPYIAQLVTIRTAIWRQMEALESMMGPKRAYCATLPLLTSIGEIDGMLAVCRSAVRENVPKGFSMMDAQQLKELARAAARKRWKQ